MKTSRFLALLCLLPSAAIADGNLPGASNLMSRQWFTDEPVLPPLDSPILFARKTGSVGDGTRQVLSLIHEQSATNENAFAWPLYVQLDASNDHGDNVGITSRMYNRGLAWSAGVHTEGITWANTTAIGFNAEMSPMSGNPRSIGINLLAKNGYATPIGIWSDSAVNIQTAPGVGWAQGILLDGALTNTGIEFGPTSRGQRAIWVRGDYAVGIDMGDNTLRLNAGAKVCLEATGQVCMHFVPGRIEFINGENSLGYLDLAETGNKCLNC